MPSYYNVYEGFEFEICLLINRRIKGDQYRPNVRIRREEVTTWKSMTKGFTDARYFSTEEEAIRYGIVMARDIIDGRVESCSVVDL